MNKEWGVRRIAVLVPWVALEGKPIGAGEVVLLVEEEQVGGLMASFEVVLPREAEVTDWDYYLEKQVRKKGFRVLAMIDLVQFRSDPKGGSYGLAETAALEKARAGPRGYGQEHG